MKSKLSFAASEGPAKKRPSILVNFFILALFILVNHVLHPKPSPAPDLKPGLYPTGFQIPLGPNSTIYLPPYQVRDAVSPR